MSVSFEQQVKSVRSSAGFARLSNEQKEAIGAATAESLASVLSQSAFPVLSELREKRGDKTATPTVGNFCNVAIDVATIDLIVASAASQIEALKPNNQKTPLEKFIDHCNTTYNAIAIESYVKENGRKTNDRASIVFTNGGQRIIGRKGKLFAVPCETAYAIFCFLQLESGRKAFLTEIAKLAENHTLISLHDDDKDSGWRKL